MRLSLKDTHENVNRVGELLSFPMLLVPGIRHTHKRGGGIMKCKVVLQDLFKNNCIFSTKNALTVFFREKEEDRVISVFLFPSIYRTLASISTEDT